MHMCIYILIHMRSIVKISVPPNGTPSLVGNASALDMTRTWFRILASVTFFLFVPLRPFVCAALAKR